ncbi:hypothetical protein FRC06_004913 [Ceratobasidium sp. 370]|nr:hypothetical protein FRC06_004913 [Ceratobasidium sp. 370]
MKLRELGQGYQILRAERLVDQGQVAQRLLARRGQVVEHFDSGGWRNGGAVETQRMKAQLAQEQDRSAFQRNYVPQVYLCGHTNQCEVLYHPAGMRSTHHGLLAATAGFQPTSNEYMEALRKFVRTFNLPETI